jgi:integrase
VHRRRTGGRRAVQRCTDSGDVGLRAAQLVGDLLQRLAIVAQLADLGSVLVAVTAYFGTATDATLLSSAFQTGYNALRQPHALLIGNRAENGDDRVLEHACAVQILFGEALEGDAKRIELLQVLQRGNRFCQILGQCFKLAIERKYLSSAPLVKRLSEVGNERKGFFTEAEIRSVIDHLPEYLKDFVLFAYITGMRRGEVQSLRWSDIHGDTITLRPENSKNSEARTIPLEGELEEVIERSKAARRVERKDGSVLISEYIFHLNGRPIGEFRKAWAMACKFANVPGRLFHDLRRCAARNLLASGVPQAVAMKITGHKTDSMFRRYAIVTVEQQREALRAARLYREQQATAQREKLATMRAATKGAN